MKRKESHYYPTDIPAGYVFLGLAIIILIYRFLKNKKIKFPNLSKLKGIFSVSFNGFGKMVRINGQGVTPDFFISKRLVTIEDWNKLAGGKRKTLKNKHPICQINWYEAIAYCNLLSAKEKLYPYYDVTSSYIKINVNANGYRLPTEKEWILAATNGKSIVNLTDKMCWYNGNRGGRK